MDSKFWWTSLIRNFYRGCKSVLEKKFINSFLNISSQLKLGRAKITFGGSLPFLAHPKICLCIYGTDDNTVHWVKFFSSHSWKKKIVNYWLEVYLQKNCSLFLVNYMLLTTMENGYKKTFANVPNLWVFLLQTILNIQYWAANITILIQCQLSQY